MKRIIRLLAALVERHALLVVIVTLLASGGFGYAATLTEVSTGQEGFAPENDEILASEQIGELFGQEATRSVMQVVIRSEGGEVIAPDALEVTRRITAALKASEYADVIDGEAAQPGTVSYLAPVELAAFQAGIDPTTLDAAEFADLYRSTLDAAGPELSFVAQLVPQGTNRSAEVGLMLVFIEVTTDFDAQIEREFGIAELIREQASGDIEVQPFTFNLLFEDGFDFEAELARLFGAAFAIIIGVLLFVYWLRPGGNATRLRSIRRALADTGVTMFTILLAIVWMQGIGALLQQAGVLGALTEITQIVPILLIGLGVDYGIHLTSRYRDEVGAGASVDAGASRAIGTVGVALVLATITTVIGFLTNIFNPIPALVDFGVLAAVGIAASFLLMLSFVPALRVLLDRRAEIGGRLPTDGMGATSSRLLPQLMGRTSVLAEKLPIPTLLVMIVLGGFGYYGLANISTEFSFTDFLPDDAPLTVTLDIITDEFGGGFGETTQVLVEGEGLATTEGFNALAASIAAMADTPDVLTVETPIGRQAQVRSLLSVARGVLAPGADGLPVDPLAAQAVLAAGFDPSTGRIADDGDVPALLDTLRDAAPDEFATVVALEGERPVAALLDVSSQAGEGRAMDLRDALVDDLTPVSDAGLARIVTSQYVITGTITDALVESQVSSLAITLAVATLVLMLSFLIENRRPFLGVLTMIPVALVVLWTFGLMYASGIPFGPVTATLTGLAVGIGVPYTIHMARRFEEDRVNFADIGDAIRETTTRTGGALAGSALTTAAGFGILITSSLTPFRQLGQVVAYAIILSLLGAVLVLPSLLVLWERWHRRHGLDPVGRPTRSLVEVAAVERMLPAQATLDPVATRDGVEHHDTSTTGDVTGASLGRMSAFRTRLRPFLAPIVGAVVIGGVVNLVRRGIERR